MKIKPIIISFCYSSDLQEKILNIKKENNYGVTVTRQSIVIGEIDYDLLSDDGFYNLCFDSKFKSAAIPLSKFLPNLTTNDSIIITRYPFDADRNSNSFFFEYPVFDFCCNFAALNNFTNLNINSNKFDELLKEIAAEYINFMLPLFKKTSGLSLYNEYILLNRQTFKLQALENEEYLNYLNYVASNCEKIKLNNCLSEVVINNIKNKVKI